MGESVRGAFEEDRAILNAVQQGFAETRTPHIDIATDSAPLRFRRRLRQLIEAEQPVDGGTRLEVGRSTRTRAHPVANFRAHVRIRVRCVPAAEEHHGGGRADHARAWTHAAANRLARAGIRKRVCDLYDSRRTPRAAVGRPGHPRGDGFDRFPRDARHAACALAARRSIVVCVAARLAVSIGYRPGPYLSSLRGRIRDLVPAEPMGPGGRTFRPWGCSSGRR